MSWIQQNANNYIHSDAPFSLQYIGSSWYLIDNRDQSKAIPINDIYNNPVFSVDFSNQTLLAKHFRGEGVNTPATPAFSFQGDANTGFYRISEDVMGGSVGGNKVLEINTLGLLNGTLGTDKRNIIKSQNALFSQTNPFSTSTSILSSGLGFSYTPIRSDSFLRIRFFLSIGSSYGTMTGSASFSYARVYQHTSIPAVGSAVAGTQLTTDILLGRSHSFAYFIENYSHISINLETPSANLNNRSFYLSFQNEVANALVTFFTNSTRYSGYFIEEIL